MIDTILITYGTRPFAQRVSRLLSARYEVVYASSEPFPDLLLKQNYHRIPTGVNPTFAHEILKLCLDKGCQMILPLGEMELQPINEARILLEEYGIVVLLPHDLEECFMLENPSGEIHVLKSGIDILTGDQLCGDHFSGAGILADSGDEPILCLV
ncbi:hypothetical protein H8B06_13655 [Sphingobacterium sp. DN00404]|uniref:Uncharacterized protein n=1 Tax=Sphingobacterium micropteri TaxID=2763501 RepID=A0ABR7YRA0_9SPHI|nr:hypothetical protein [Sphingobacterium micropteri]MBD1433878.1 hypothetical protein [Sphingobacterium micropteri]